MTGWGPFTGRGDPVAPGALEVLLADPPPWRVLDVLQAALDRFVPAQPRLLERGRNYVLHHAAEAEAVNTALLLRRPLLVTGPAGVGKTSLAYRVAYELGLGAPLRWEIGSRTTLQDGLYDYDAVAHLQSAQAGDGRAIGDFITLGPLGTALLPTRLPRLLLVDEIDKANFDLPNDLLHVLEEASFEIPELIRAGDRQEVHPRDSQGPNDRVPIENGRVRPAHHPILVITSNGERPFSPAFLRRCVQLDLERPSRAHILEVIRRQYGEAVDPRLAAEVLDHFAGETTDRVLQALFLRIRGAAAEETERLKERPET